MCFLFCPLQQLHYWALWTIGTDTDGPCGQNKLVMASYGSNKLTFNCAEFRGFTGVHTQTIPSFNHTLQA